MRVRGPRLAICDQFSGSAESGKVSGQIARGISGNGIGSANLLEPTPLMKTGTTRKVCRYGLGVVDGFSAFGTTTGPDSGAGVGVG